MLKQAGCAHEDQIARLVTLDRVVRRELPKVLKSISPETLAEWRESRLPDETSWWWSLEREPSLLSRFRSAPVILAWVTVALSVSVIVEDLRRLLSTASDGLSTAVQASLAFVLGGT